MDDEVVIRAGLVMVRWDIPKEESLLIIEAFEEDRPCVGSAIMTYRGRKRRSVRGASARLTGVVSEIRMEWSNVAQAVHEMRGVAGACEEALTPVLASARAGW